ncbi:MAG: TlpA disulfide reductase family protein [Acidimicrobiia bacterium]|nr:TlpA disulfide reductase family protein [Acidimicrobiia bacterium]MDX2466050.1 TlpA disulfide reductase family protein [Acidimicrobiia bacterium]
MARQSTAQKRATKAREVEERRRKEARQRLMQMVGGGIAVVVLVALFLISVWPEAAVGDTSAEAWDLPELDGDGRIALADFEGKPTVVAFFASWCEVCEDEVPELLALSKELEGDVNFVGINSQDNSQGLGDAQKWGIAGEWPLATDIGNGNGSGLSSGAFAMRGMPLNLIYDGQGNLVHVQRGGLSSQAALSFLTELTEYGA